MEINNVTGTSTSASTYANNTQAAENKTTENQAAATTSSTTQTDTYEKTNATKPEKKTYTPDLDAIAKAKEGLKKNVSAFQRMVEKMINKQIGTIQDSGYDSFLVDEQTRKEAQEATSEDGYWGVEKTSQRILDFAKSLSGGDPDKIDALKTAFEKGFSKAMGQLGFNKEEDYPEISKETYKAVMDGFDEWKKQGVIAG